MTRFHFSLIILVTCLAWAPGESYDPASKKVHQSPLLEKGPLQDVRKPLEAIFAFYLDRANLNIDREPSEEAGRKALNKHLPEREKKTRIAKDDEESGIELLFLFPIEEAAVFGSSSASGSPRNCRYGFHGEKMAGALSVQGELVRMTLEELESPRRTLEYGNDGKGNLHIQISHPAGDMVLLKQTKRSRCIAVALIDGRMAAVAGDSFVDVFRKHRKDMTEFVLPTLAHFGAEVLPAPDSPRIRQAVQKLLARTPETLAQGRELLNDLEKRDFASRVDARRLLRKNFETYHDLIEQRLADKPSLETQTQLENLLGHHQEAARVGRAVAAMDLLNDVRYLVSLFEGSSPEERQDVVSRLETLTGQKLGRDAALWRAWIQRNLK